MLALFPLALGGGEERSSAHCGGGGGGIACVGFIVKIVVVMLDG